MPVTIKEVADTFFTQKACDGERRYFKTDGQRAMFKKLHYKKCETCRNATKYNLGWNEVSYNERSVSSYMDAQERLVAQELIARTIIN